MFAGVLVMTVMIVMTRSVGGFYNGVWASRIVMAEMVFECIEVIKNRQKQLFTIVFGDWAF